MPSEHLSNPGPIKLATIAKEILSERAGEPAPSGTKNTEHIIVIRRKDREAVLVEIDTADVLTDTKKTLASATSDSLKQLKRSLEMEIETFPDCPDTKGFKAMLQAIKELLEEKDADSHG